jgi:hypothetical protein
MPKPLISDHCPRKVDKPFLFGWIAIALTTFVIYRAGYQFVTKYLAWIPPARAASVAGER